jgi:hypothetical protein
MNGELVHDAAMAMAQALLDIMRPCLDREERLNAFFQFYLACKAGLESYEIVNRRILIRLSPTQN